MFRCVAAKRIDPSFELFAGARTPHKSDWNFQERNTRRGVTSSYEKSTEEILHDSTEPEPGWPAGRPRWWTRRTRGRTAATWSANPEARSGRTRWPRWPAGWWRPARRPEPLNFSAVKYPSLAPLRRGLFFLTSSLRANGSGPKWPAR